MSSVSLASPASSASTPSLFSRLPPELLFLVFELAATDDTRAALALARVSRYTCVLVEPRLYHTVVLATARAVHAFHATLARKPRAFPTTRVRNLGIFAVGPIGAIRAVLDRCSGVRSLACAFYVQQCKPAAPSYSLARIHPLDCTTEHHLLGMSCRDGWDLRAVGPAVTHLRVHLPASAMPAMFPPPADVHGALQPQPGEDDGEHTQGWNNLAKLPSLTHLAVVYRPSVRYPVATIFEHLSRLLPSPLHTQQTQPPLPTLSLILVQIIGSSVAPSPGIDALNALALHAGGPALRIVAERAPMSAATQWERGVRHGSSVWTAAEEVVCGRYAQAAATARRK